VAVSVHVALAVAGSTQHGSPDVAQIEPEIHRNGHVAAAAGDGIEHEERSVTTDSADGEDAAVAAPEQGPVSERRLLLGAQGEAPRRDAVGRVEDGGEYQILPELLEDAEDRRLPVVREEAAAEAWVGRHARPELGDGAGARERRG
jgi:hypothetical protein